MNLLTDAYGRIHDYLRISLTDHCNFRCFYCMPDEHHRFMPAARLMQTAEIIHLAKLFTAQGVRKIRLTGGEPLARKDAATIITELGQLPIELVLTTNGTRVHEVLPALISAKVKSINISLDTLNPEKFLKITRRDLFHTVKNNIRLLLDNKIAVKVNVVMIKNLNDNEIKDFLEWTRDTPLQIRFIEYMPFSDNGWSCGQICSMKEILVAAKTHFNVMPVQGKPNDTAKHFSIPGHKGSFAIISTMTDPFCGTCNRIRLTADGKLKNCLFSHTETDLLTPLRNQEDVLALIKESIWHKKEKLGGQLATNPENIDTQTIKNRSMISIGG